MIELELKYKINRIPTDLNQILPTKQKEQCDIYYDTMNYDMLRGGNFLRVRNNKNIDFKVDLDDNNHLYCKETSFDFNTISQRIESINRILTAINLPQSPDVISFSDFIIKNNMQELAIINKKRTEYHFSNINISIDEVKDLGLFLEAEIMINSDQLDSSNAENYKEALKSKLEELGLLSNCIEEIAIGYVELYLLKYNTDAYNLGKFKQ